jgi:hypothetical protein
MPTDPPLRLTSPPIAGAALLAGARALPPRWCLSSVGPAARRVLELGHHGDSSSATTVIRLRRPGWRAFPSRAAITRSGADAGASDRDGAGAEFRK